MTANAQIGYHQRLALRAGNLTELLTVDKVELAVLAVEDCTGGLLCGNNRDAPTRYGIGLVGLKLCNAYRERNRLLAGKRARTGHVPRANPCIVGVAARARRYAAAATVGRRCDCRLHGRLGAVNGIYGAGILRVGLQLREHQVETLAQSVLKLRAGECIAFGLNQLLERCAVQSVIEFRGQYREVFGRLGILERELEGQRRALRTGGLSAGQRDGRSRLGIIPAAGIGVGIGVVVVTTASREDSGCKDTHEGHLEEIRHFHTLGIFKLDNENRVLRVCSQTTLSQI